MSLLRSPICLCAVLAAVCLAAPRQPAAEDRQAETPAEMVRKALGHPHDLEINDQPIDAAVNLLREQTGINFVLDQAALPAQALAVLPHGAVAGQLGGSYLHLRLSIHATGRPVRDVLSAALQDHDFTYAVVGDTVYITTPERALERQLRQRICLAVHGEPLGDVLHRLARQTGANIVTNARQAKAAQAAVTAELADVPLEAAVRVLADQADLELARIGNILYVTGAGRAEKLQKQAARPRGAPAGWRVYPDGLGGFHLAPPAGLGGAIGFAGIRGAPPGGGLVGLGALGALGMGGGMLGIGGGAAPPVPLSPPLPGKAAPKPKAPAPDKPDASKLKGSPQAPAKPAAAPSGKDPPAPPDKKPDPAAKPSGTPPKSRRSIGRPRGWGKKQRATSA
jgi:hypothetical protein